MATVASGHVSSEGTLAEAASSKRASPQLELSASKELLSTSAVKDSLGAARVSVSTGLVCSRSMLVLDATEAGSVLDVTAAALSTVEQAGFPGAAVEKVSTMGVLAGAVAAGKVVPC
jgi:hypothetical protein